MIGAPRSLARRAMLLDGLDEAAPPPANRALTRLGGGRSRRRLPARHRPRFFRIRTADARLLRADPRRRRLA